MRKLLFVMVYGLLFLVSETSASSPKWNQRFGGILTDIGSSVATDVSGNVYTTGYFSGVVDFNPGAATFNLISKGGQDIFISKLDVAGNFIWAKRIGGSGNDYARAIVLDDSGNIYSVGNFSGICDFDPNSGVYNLTSADANPFSFSYDIYISKLDAQGNFIWAKNMGGSGFDMAEAIALDAAGNIYTTGNFGDTADFDPNAGVYNLIEAGNNDIFISKLDAAGNFVWAKGMGGAFEDYSYSVKVDKGGNVYTAGTFQNTADFNPGLGLFNMTSSGNEDIYISKINSAGNFMWAKRIGTASKDLVIAMTADATGNLFATGLFTGTVDFDPNTGVTNLTAVGGPTGNYDLFITKLDTSGALVWAKNMGGTGNTWGNAIAVDGSGNVYTAGAFHGTVDFDPGASITNLSADGTATDIFIAKLNNLGDFIWAKTMHGNTSEDDEPFSIVVDANGNLYSTGYFQGTVDFDPNAGINNLTSAGGSDIFLLKMSQTGLGIVSTFNNKGYEIYPNPSSGEFEIETTLNGNYSIINELGQRIMEFVLSATNDHSVKLTGLSPGIYFLTGMSDDKIIREKIVVTR